MISLDTPKIYSRTASLVRTRSGNQGLNDMSTKFKRSTEQSSGGGTGAAHGSPGTEMSEERRSQPSTRPSSRAGRDDATAVNEPASPKYSSLVNASENRVKFSDFDSRGVEIGAPASVQPQQEDTKSPKIQDSQQDAGKPHAKHWAEIPHSDVRGGVVSFDEGNVRVTEGADGRIHVQSLKDQVTGVGGPSTGVDINAEERDIGLNEQEKQEVHEDMPNDASEAEMLKAYKEKRMRRDVG